jgi:hypothetical protein
VSTVVNQFRGAVAGHGVPSDYRLEIGAWEDPTELWASSARAAARMCSASSPVSSRRARRTAARRWIGYRLARTRSWARWRRRRRWRRVSRQPGAALAEREYAQSLGGVGAWGGAGGIAAVAAVAQSAVAGDDREFRQADAQRSGDGGVGGFVQGDDPEVIAGGAFAAREHGAGDRADQRGQDVVLDVHAAARRDRLRR